MSRVPRSNPKRLNDTFNGKDSGVGTNVTPFGVGANVTPGVGANVTPVPNGVVEFLQLVECRLWGKDGQGPSS